MTPLAAVHAGHEILCRFDPVKGKPVVFVATEMTPTEIRSWISGSDTEMSPMSYYHATLPLSAADEDVLLKRFARQFSQKHVVLRHRLPRQMRAVQNRFAKMPYVAVILPDPVAAPLAITVEALARAAGLPDTLPPAVQALLDQAITLMQPAAPEVVAPPEAPKPARKRAAPAKLGSRKPAAKPINGQPVSRRAAKSVKPDALAQKVEALTELVNTLVGKLGEVTPVAE